MFVSLRKQYAIPEKFSETRGKEIGLDEFIVACDEDFTQRLWRREKDALFVQQYVVFDYAIIGNGL